MPLIPIKTPIVAKKIFPNYIWDVATSEKIIYLTFDDGPTPEITTWTLDILKQFQAKATFFCIGHNIEKYPDIFQKTVNDGHAIGNHTQNHIKGWRVKTKKYLSNITIAQKVIDKQTQKSTNNNLFRPPYGQITPKQGKQLMALGYHIIMWDVLSFDWEDSVNKETCLDNVISKTRAGSIIVFHDSLKASKNMQYTLPKVLEHFSKEGYRFEAIHTSF